MMPETSVPCHELPATPQPLNFPLWAVSSAEVIQSPASPASASRPSPSLAVATSDHHVIARQHASPGPDGRPARPCRAPPPPRRRAAGGGPQRRGLDTVATARPHRGRHRGDLGVGGIATVPQVVEAAVERVVDSHGRRDVRPLVGPHQRIGLGPDDVGTPRHLRGQRLGVGQAHHLGADRRDVADQDVGADSPVDQVSDGAAQDHRPGVAAHLDDDAPGERRRPSGWLERPPLGARCGRRRRREDRGRQHQAHEGIARLMSAHPVATSQLPDRPPFPTG